MSVILNFKKWKQIYEQATGASTSLDFVVFSGASSKSMSDATLHSNQGFPQPTDKNPLNHLYEIDLASALAGNFTRAVIIKPVDKASPDQIIFDGMSITNSGKFVIEWNAANSSKKIQVSGNGALVLARAADNTKNIDPTTLLKQNGAIVLELAASELYSKYWSIVSSGLDTDKLVASLNGRINQVAVAVADSTLKPKLIAKWTSTPAWVESEYAPHIIERTPDDSTVVISPPGLPINTSIKQYYGTYSDTRLTSNDANPLAKIAKSSIVDAGLTALSKYVPEYFSRALAGLDQQYTDRLVAKIQDNITRVKSGYNMDRVKSQLAYAVVGKPGAVVPTTTTKTTATSTKYKEGSSTK